MQRQKMEWFAIKRELNCYGLFGRRINGGQQRQQTDSQSTSRRRRIPRVSPQIWALVRTRHKTRPPLPYPSGPSPTSHRERKREIPPVPRVCFPAQFWRGRFFSSGGGIKFSATARFFFRALQDFFLGHCKFFLRLMEWSIIPCPFLCWVMHQSNPS
jgi:hypothetical protein